MNIKKMKKEDLELLSYTKIAELCLKENKKTMTTKELFLEICDLLELESSQYEDKITDFFQSLITSKEFILLQDGTWDLKENHSIKMEIDEDYEEEEIKEEEDEIEKEEDDEVDLDDYDATEDDYEEDELGDLSIVDEEEIE